MRRKWFLRVVGTLFCVALLSVSVWARLADPKEASALVFGNPNGATDRLSYQAATGAPRSIVYFSSTARSGTTPFASKTFCGMGDFKKFAAQLTLTGTMSGTNPTATLLWQHSYDGGANWISVGTWTTINSTVTPASQTQIVSDVEGSTATVYGDCWRALLTLGGTTPGVIVKLAGYNEP